MAKSLVVVESPAKAKTINKYLGRNYKVIASMGHVRDLPKSKLGVDIEEGFEPSYEVIASRKKVLKELKDAAKDADTIYIATDPDREGEAIGWHLAEELGRGNEKKIRRLMFNEITKKGVLAALEHPTEINKQMVDAQQARRVLDRLVGYKISPLLWDKVRRGLSAGRVQSVALKLVCDRERGDRPRSSPRSTGTSRRGWPARSRPSSTPSCSSATARTSRSATRKKRTRRSPICGGSLWTVSVGHHQGAQEGRGAALHHQQAAAGVTVPGQEDDDDRAAALRRHRAARRCGTVGLITYMRTDSTRVSEQALTEVREFIGEKFGPDYVPEKPNLYQDQEGRAGRPRGDPADLDATADFHPDKVRAHLTPDQYYLYRLIWNRFVASQMPPATFDETTVDIDAKADGAPSYLFRVKGSVPKFAGWMAVYNQEQVEARTEGPGPDAVTAEDEEGSSLLPPLAEGDRLELKELKPEQKFTQPPPRYSEATLVKALEENGIGRPSTYASIIGVIQAREYVNKIEGRFKPTVLGRMLVEKLLSPAFDDILDVDYTRELEEELDKIEEGTENYKSTLSSFYKKFEKDLKRAAKRDAQLQGRRRAASRRSTCDKCGKPMVIKAGKFGLFLACSGYPECENTRELETPDSRGRRARHRGRRARTAASRWPSSAAASGSSSPAPAIRSARRPGRSSPPSRA